ncbi:MAG: hypothetical protein AAF363_17430 [Bacteroidota bacterium]
MKNLILLSFIFVFPLLSQAQTFDKPERGAVIRMNDYSHKMQAGTSSSVETWLIKSKREQKREFGNLVSSQPNGLKVSFEPKEGDLYLMTLEASNDIKPGSYTLMIKGSGKNAHKTRSTTFNVNVTSNKAGLAVN